MWPSGHHESVGACCRLQIERSRQFGSERQNTARSLRRLQKLIEQWYRGSRNPFERVHSPAERADKRAFEVDAEDFGTRCASIRLGACREPRHARVVTHPRRDAGGSAASALGGRGHGGGHQRSGAAPRDSFRDGGESRGGALHHVVATRAVYVQVDEAGDNRKPGRVVLAHLAPGCRGRQCKLRPGSRSRNPAVFNQNESVSNFLIGREYAVGEDGVHGCH